MVINLEKINQMIRTCIFIVTKIAVALIFLFFLINATIPKNKNNNFKQNNQQYSFIAGYAKVIDGDSIIINNQNIRLFGIDAPEYQQKCFDKNIIEYQCGLYSKKFLKKLISNNKVTCSYHKKDIYDRILGECQVSGFNINKKMIAAGWAILYNFSQSSKEMQDLEISSKRESKGLWQGSFLEPKKYRKKFF
jgi:endonuclease YncB( thermonuclease family)